MQFSHQNIEWMWTRNVCAQAFYEEGALRGAAWRSVGWPAMLVTFPPSILRCERVNCCGQQVAQGVVWSVGSRAPARQKSQNAHS